MPQYPEMEFDPVAMIKFICKNGHNAVIGTRYHAHGPDWAELELPYDKKLVSDEVSGILASGPILTMMDMVTSMSIWLKSGKFQSQATLDLRIDYLRPAKPGNSVYGHGECYHVTKSIAFVRGYAHDGDPDRPIAHVAGTYFFTSAT